MPGDLVLLQAFCQWKVEHQIRKCCVKGLTMRNMAGRERYARRLYESGCKPVALPAQKVFGRAKYNHLKRATVFCSDTSCQSTE